MRRMLLTATLAATLALSLVGAAQPAAAVPAPYYDPAFGAACDWHRFGEGQTPPWWLFLQDPLCVEYSKRDITFDNGGALLFLLAEPARVAVAIPTCRYWQLDHWSVQVTTGAVPIVAWDGSYWFDKRARLAALKLRNFKVNGASAGIGDAVAAIRPYFPLVADALARYGASPGETGMVVGLLPDLFCL